MDVLSHQFVFCVQKLRSTENDELRQQVQAYLDNIFDVAMLVEDAETKTAAIERVSELSENNSHVSGSKSAPNL